MRDAENISAIDKLDVDWMGFIFYSKSPRYVEVMPSIMPTSAKRVGVFVNDSIDNIKNIAKKYALDIVQLHGTESPEMCLQLSESGLKVMKAFSVMDSFPTTIVNSYQHACQYFLFDTQTISFGGSGNKFDWSILSEYKGNVPFLLSGGISDSDVDSIRRINHPQMIGIDINSRFELSPALKDVNQVKQFIKHFK